MKKKALLAALLALTLLLSSCSLVVKDEIKDANTPILKLGDQVVTKAEVQAATNNSLYYQYLMYYYYYGYELDMSDPEIVASIQSEVIADLKQDLALHAKEKELGLDQLTDEESTLAKENALENIKNNLLSADELELEGDELEAAIQAKLEEYGYTYEDYEKAAVDEIVGNKLREYAVKDVAVSDEEVKAEYDSKVAADEEKYKEDADSWTSADRNGTTLYYTPAGIRRVKQILLKFKEDDETALDEADAKVSDAESKAAAAQSAIEEAEAVQANEEATQEEKDAAAADLAAAQADLEAAQAELEAAQAEYDAARETAFANLDEDADAILAALAENPDSWDQLVEEKNEDPGMQAGAVNAEKGYAIFEGMTGFDTAFMDAAMALQSVGDISDKTASDLYGYYIIKYAGDEAEGPVDYDSVKDALYDTLLSGKKDEAYTQAVTQWVAEAGIKEDLGALND